MYRCGIGGRLAKLMKVARDPRPHIICDGCGAKIIVEFPPKWFLNKKPPPGWKTIRHEDGTRTDYCKTCKGNCTGVAAEWCPIHGDCTCERNEAGERIMDEDGSKDCPLHSTWSTHAKPMDDEFEDGGTI